MDGAWAWRPEGSDSRVACEPQLPRQATATETPGRPRVRNLECARQIGAPASMPRIAGHDRGALYGECS
jgi:hypothetical protein